MTKGSRDRTIATIGIDIGKNSFHLIGMGAVGTIVLRQKLTRSQIGVRLSIQIPNFTHSVRCLGPAGSASARSRTANISRSHHELQIPTVIGVATGTDDSMNRKVR